MAEQNAGVPPQEIIAGAPPMRSVAFNKESRTSTLPAKSVSRQQKKAPPVATEPKDSLREVVETIVFVVVLVLLLKSFVAEAFVIPTGSMAETLYGYQKLITCPECSFHFPVNVSQEVDPSEAPPTRITGCTCPNCRHHIDIETAAAAI